MEDSPPGHPQLNSQYLGAHHLPQYLIDVEIVIIVPNNYPRFRKQLLYSVLEVGFPS